MWQNIKVPYSKREENDSNKDSWNKKISDEVFRTKELNKDLMSDVHIFYVDLKYIIRTLYNDLSN